MRGYSVTLTARREPTFDGVAHDGHHDDAAHGGGAHGLAYAAPKSTGLLRIVSTVQIVGSLLAVPVGLASAYSVYRVNFSPETTCQQLRGNIISMLDKSVDAATRRMLVRRDVEAFEQNCGSVDPDARTAFKRLLATDVPVAAALPKAGPRPDPKVAKIDAKIDTRTDAKADAKTEAKVKIKPEAKAEKAEAKVEAKPERKVEAKAVAKAEANPEPTPREDTLSDTRWVAAVRQALVKHPVKEESETPLLQPSWNVTPADAPQPASLARAPQLPPAQTVPTQPAQTPVNVVDHPVPPAPIPEAQPVDLKEAGNGHSRLGGWIAEIPFVGRAIAR
jgi:hypothetical protein